MSRPSGLTFDSYCAKVWRLLAVVCVFFAAPGYGSEPNIVALLDRGVWRFSPSEIIELNGLTKKALEPKLITLLRESGRLVGDDAHLLDFKMVSLNQDGTIQILARIDESGRGLALGLDVISRQGTSIRSSAVEDWGSGIQLWANHGRSFIVTSQAVFFVHRTDPNHYFPQLYAWTDSKCEDVSAQSRGYYEGGFRTRLENEIERRLVDAGGGDPESRRFALVDALGLAFVAKRLAELFPDLSISPELDEKLARLLATLAAGSTLDRQISEALRLVGSKPNQPVGGLYVPSVPTKSVSPQSAHATVPPEAGNSTAVDPVNTDALQLSARRWLLIAGILFAGVTIAILAVQAMRR